jgi:hypothetical protein
MRATVWSHGLTMVDAGEIINLQLLYRSTLTRIRDHILGGWDTQ